MQSSWKWCSHLVSRRTSSSTENLSWHIVHSPIWSRNRQVNWYLQVLIYMEMYRLNPSPCYIKRQSFNFVFMWSLDTSVYVAFYKPMPESWLAAIFSPLDWSYDICFNVRRYDGTMTCMCSPAFKLLSAFAQRQATGSGHTWLGHKPPHWSTLLHKSQMHPAQTMLY